MKRKPKQGPVPKKRASSVEGSKVATAGGYSADEITFMVMATTSTLGNPASFVETSAEAWLSQGPEARKEIASAFFDQLDASLMVAWGTLDAVQHTLDKLRHPEVAFEDRVVCRVIIARFRNWAQIVKSYNEKMDVDDEFFVPQDARNELAEVAKKGVYIAMAVREMLGDPLTPSPSSHIIDMTREEFLDTYKLPALDAPGKWMKGKAILTNTGLARTTLANYRGAGEKTKDELAGRDPDGRIWIKANKTAHPLYLRDGGATSSRSKAP